MSLSLSNPVVVTKAQASIDELGSDYTGGSTEEFLMYEITWNPTYAGVYVYEGDEWEYISIQFEFQVFGGVTETPTMPGVPTFTTPGDVAFHSASSMELEPQQSVFNLQAASGISPGLTVVRWVAISGSALTNALIPSYVLGKFYLQVAPGNEGSNITVSLVDTLTTQYNRTQGENYTVQSGSFPSTVYTIPALDNRVYVKNTELGALASATQYEGVTDDTDSLDTTGNIYILDDSTGKLHYSDLAGTDITAQHYNCAYSCAYVDQYTYTFGAEVIGTDRPDNLYAINSAGLLWTLT